MREIFKKARQVSPSIIFFDEIDALAPRRGISSESHVSERVVNQMLTEIDGLEEMHDVVIIAATNRPDIVDTALLRPGRFDRMILTSAPDEQSRFDIFKVHSLGMPLKYNGTISTGLRQAKKKSNAAGKTASDEPVQEDDSRQNDSEKEIIVDSKRDAFLLGLAKRAEGYAGADIEAVCREAAIYALREDINAKSIGAEHFEKALEKIPPSITPDIEKAYDEMRQHFSSARGKQMMQEKPIYMG